MNTTEQTNDLRDLLSFVKPIEHLLLDPGISEVMVNANGSVYSERDGVKHREAFDYPSWKLEPAVVRIARNMGQNVDEKLPRFEGRLADGSRVSITVPPCSVGGITFNVRKFAFSVLTLQDLVDNKTLNYGQRDDLLEALDDRKSILICGQTGAGKTTLLQALACCLPLDDRIILIEDVNEIRLPHQNICYFETRPADERLGFAAVTIADLLRSALRHRPDRIIVGEVRGAEAFDLIQAMNTGHEGSLATIHANSPRMALSRLRACVAMAGIDLEPATFASMIAEVVGLVVQIRREGPRRVVSEIARIDGYDRQNDSYRLINEV